ncbi:MAG: hypothetical protein JNK05_01320 [Myxococcales bacterium]|nr:hypothetical protein [Myxococcales bacterium]
MKALRIPTALVVATIAGAASISCAPRPAPPDAQSDGSSDVAQNDGGACMMQDVPISPPFARTLCGQDVDGSLRTCGAPCSDGTCSGNCRLCVASEFEGDIGIACRPRAGSMADCPRRVCQASDCPTGCETCLSPLFCIPDETMADGATPMCTGTTCDPANGCPAGCRAVG